MDRIKNITGIVTEEANAARKHWNSIAKPLNSLGVLEDMIIQIAGIQGTEKVSLERCTAVIMCGDHGVTACGVTQCDSSVTASCAKDIAEGRSNINAMAKSIGAEVIAVDAGIASDVVSDKLICRKIAYGTENMTLSPAMTEEQCRKAISVGIDTVKELQGKTDIIVSGEMGIGNTTAAAAMACVMLGEKPEFLTGRGAGLSDEGLEKKISAVRKAIEVNSPDKNNAFDILRKVGGLEIAAMTGLFLGGAVYHIPVVIDGVISAAAAAAAYGIEPISAEYMLASHCSNEPAAKGLLRSMGLRPVIDAKLQLGEGTGGIMLIPLLRAALAVYDSAHTFEDIELEQYKDYTV